MNKKQLKENIAIEIEKLTVLRKDKEIARSSEIIRVNGQIEGLNQTLQIIKDHEQSLPKIVALVLFGIKKETISIYQNLNRQLSYKGYIVLNCDMMVGTKIEKDKLEKLNLQKVDMADEIYMVNDEEQLFETSNEYMNYIIHAGKPVHYLSRAKEMF